MYGYSGAISEFQVRPAVYTSLGVQPAEGSGEEETKGIKKQFQEGSESGEIRRGREREREKNKIGLLKLCSYYYHYPNPHQSHQPVKGFRT